MKLDKLTCKSCGAPLSVDGHFASCGHCGTPHAVRDDEVVIAEVMPPSAPRSAAPPVGKPQPDVPRFSGWVLALVGLLFVVPAAVGLLLMGFFFTSARRAQRDFHELPHPLSGTMHGSREVRVEVQGDLPPEVKRQVERALREKLR